MDSVYTGTGSTLDLTEHSLKTPVYEIGILIHV
jgi:hypothetical protein